MKYLNKCCFKSSKSDLAANWIISGCGIWRRLCGFCAASKVTALKNASTAQSTKIRALEATVAQQATQIAAQSTQIATQANKFTTLESTATARLCFTATSHFFAAIYLLQH
jgi:uncharacterized coiled-coil protein SlyX